MLTASVCGEYYCRHYNEATNNSQKLEFLAHKESENKGQHHSAYHRKDRVNRYACRLKRLYRTIAEQYAHDRVNECYRHRKQRKLKMELVNYQKQYQAGD
jgi:hypothetical protein